jgi:methionyl-tRNA formyltransferase
MIRIYALCATNNGLDVVDLVRHKLPIVGIIGLVDKKKSDTISNLADAQTYCQQRGLEFIGISDYSLESAEARKTLSAIKISVLLAFAWQRLVPEWLLSQCRIGALGLHGSARGITAGRGRSPQNWALMMGMQSFDVSLFWLDPGIDSGPIIASRNFPLTDEDDIATSHTKTSIAAAEMLLEAANNGSLVKRDGKTQDTDATYLPQRRPEDGAIDWTQPRRRILDFIRALVPPYPCAFSNLENGRLVIRRARRFDCPTSHPPVPGRIAAAFIEGGMIVETGNGAILIDAWTVDGTANLSPGYVLPSVNAAQQIERIIARHRKRYPELPIAIDVLNYAELLRSKEDL